MYRHVLDRPEYALELSCYITAILCAVDLSSCHSRTGIRTGWQWQLAAYAVTSAWINLLYRIRQIPFLGIYVLMVIDVLYTFLKFAVIILLFVIAFSLGFHCLLAQQVREHVRYFQRTMLKQLSSSVSQLSHTPASPASKLSS